VRLAEVGVERRRLLEISQAFGIIRAVEPEDMLQSEVIGGPRAQILRLAKPRPLSLVVRNLQFEHADHLRKDLLTNFMQLVDVALVKVAPDGASRVQVDELDSDGYPAARGVDGPGQAVGHPQCRADLSQISRPAAEAE